jgi:hypothetical protein
MPASARNSPPNSRTAEKTEFPGYPQGDPFRRHLCAGMSRARCGPEKGNRAAGRKGTPRKSARESALEVQEAGFRDNWHFQSSRRKFATAAGPEPGLGRFPAGAHAPTLVLIAQRAGRAVLDPLVLFQTPHLDHRRFRRSPNPAFESSWVPGELHPARLSPAARQEPRAAPRPATSPRGGRVNSRRGRSRTGRPQFRLRPRVPRSCPRRENANKVGGPDADKCG